MKYLILLYVVITTTFASCNQFYFNQFQPTIQGHKELCFDQFTVLYNSQTKTPIYSAEVLNGETPHLKRDAAFHTELTLQPNERATLDDYKQVDNNNIHYDRGHMSPSADMTTQQAQYQSFSLANMIPQIGVCVS